MMLRLLMLAACCVAAAGSSFAAEDAAVAKIDELLAAHWQEHGVEAPKPATDEVFVRRAYLEIAGRIPTRAEALEFLRSQKADKRTQLVDKLLDGDGYAQHFFHFWADILRAQTRANGGQGVYISPHYVEHLKRRIRENQHYDDFVYELVSARGAVWNNPAIGYYARDIGMPLDNLALTSRIFLGTRIECAQCHDHPFDKWKQMEFYRLAAYTFPQDTNHTGIAGVKDALKLHWQAVNARSDKLKNASEAERNALERETQFARWVGKSLDDLGDFIRYCKVDSVPDRHLKLPHDYQYDDGKPGDPVQPATLLGPAAPVADGESSLDAFARWLASPDNPRFTTVIVNRLWKRAFGRGLIEPVDELLDDTKASHPELLAHLERVMVALDYDMKAFQRVLYSTKAWQAETSRQDPGAEDGYRFDGPLLHRMSAEQIWDSFVTLIHVTPDLPRAHGIDDDLARRIAHRRKLSDALDTLTSQELFDGAMAASQAYERASEQSRGLREQYAAATKAKDKEAMKRLIDEIRAIDLTARSSVNDHLVAPAVARLFHSVTGKDATPEMLASVTSAGGGMMMNMADQVSPEQRYLEVPGYEPSDDHKRDEQECDKKRTAIFRAEARRLKVPPDMVDRYVETRRGHAREWMRAADIESPAPRGHALRDFGQSDRNMVEKANRDTTIPQALVLMNSPILNAILSPGTQLRLGIDAATSPEQQAEAVSLALLARRPTAAELAAWSKARASGLDRIDDLVFALVNSRQFVFVR